MPPSEGDAPPMLYALRNGLAASVLPLALYGLPPPLPPFWVYDTEEEVYAETGVRGWVPDLGLGEGKPLEDDRLGVVGDAPVPFVPMAVPSWALALYS